MVTHDTRLVKFCDRVLEMKDGMLKEKELSEDDAHPDSV